MRAARRTSSSGAHMNTGITVLALFRAATNAGLSCVRQSLCAGGAQRGGRRVRLAHARLPSSCRRVQCAPEDYFSPQRPRHAPSEPHQHRVQLLRCAALLLLVRRRMLRLPLRCAHGQAACCCVHGTDSLPSWPHAAAAHRLRCPLSARARVRAQEALSVCVLMRVLTIAWLCACACFRITARLCVSAGPRGTVHCSRGYTRPSP
jgi:hypothetical protein